MRNYAVILIFVTVLACCNGPVAEASKAGRRDQNTDPLAKSLPLAPPVRINFKKHDQATDHTANQKEAGSKWNVMSKLGISSTKFLLPYVVDSTLDGNSHTWIYSVSDNGDVVRAILFVTSGGGVALGPQRGDPVYEVYLETYPDGTEKRILLSSTEAEREICKIEAVLAARGAKNRYDYFYAGGALQEIGTNDNGDRDPFSQPKQKMIDLESDVGKRELAEAFNQSTLITIAGLARHYRSSIRGRTSHRTE